MHWMAHFMSVIPAFLFYSQLMTISILLEDINMPQGGSSINTRYKDSSDDPEKINGSDLQHAVAEGSFLHRNDTLDTGFIDRTHSFNDHCSIVD